MLGQSWSWTVEVTIVVRDLPLDGDRAGVVLGTVSYEDFVAEVGLLHLEVVGVARGAYGRRAGGEDDEPQHRCARSAPGVRGPLLDLSARAAASAALNGLPPSFKLSSLTVAALCAVRLRRTMAGKPARVGQCGTPPQPVSAANCDLLSSLPKCPTTLDCPVGGTLKRRRRSL